MSGRTLAGIHAAMVTPFDATGALGEAAVPGLVEFVLAQGVAGFYVGGSTGESFLMSLEERVRMLKAVAQANRGRGCLIAHVGAIATADTVAIGQAAVRADYDAVSAIPPFYYDFGRDELLAHYKTVAESVELPLIIYNFPARVGNALGLDEILQLLDHPRIVGVKHTSQNLYQLERIKRHRPDALIFNGFDEMATAGLATGADGAIGTTFNFMGWLFVKIETLLRSGDIEAARYLQALANDVVDFLIKEGVLPATKLILDCMGCPVGECRPPFRRVGKAQQEEAARLVERLAEQRRVSLSG